jgi:hypothetical protein
MGKSNVVFLFGAFVLPAVTQVAYLVISEPFYSDSMFQVDVAVFFASLASGCVCYMRSTRHLTMGARILLLVVYMAVYCAVLFKIRQSICVTCGWRESRLIM